MLYPLIFLFPYKKKRFSASKTDKIKAQNDKSLSSVLCFWGGTSFLHAPASMLIGQEALCNGNIITEIQYKSTTKNCTIILQGGGFLDTHERLKALLAERGWSEYRLAKEAKLSESTIINIFRRNATPSIPTLEAICDGMGITLSQFFSENDMVELNPELKTLFDGWVFLTPQQKAALLSVVEAFREK